MNTDRDVTRTVRSWLEVGVTALPDRVLDAVLEQLPATPQRRAWWPARRLHDMNTPIRFAVAAAAIVAVAVAGIYLLPRAGGFGSPQETPGTSPTPGPTPLALREGPLAAGAYLIRPSDYGDNWRACIRPPQPGCSESTTDDSIRFTFTVPDGWAGLEDKIVRAEGFEAPDGAALLFGQGGWLHREPCRTEAATPDIPVGPSVDDFAGALADHPALEVTTPVDVSVGGYAGKYVDLEVPPDISACNEYRPWEPAIYAQGPANRWHLWILDVEGVRVVVQTQDFPGTPAQDRAELRAMVDSIQIEP